MLYTISKSFKNRAQALLPVAFALVLIVAGCSATPKPAVSTSDSGSGEDRVINGLSVSDEAGAVKVTINGSSSLRYTSVKQAFPLGIVLYFPGTKLENVDSEYPPDGDILNSIKTSQQSHSAGYDSRIKILLNKDVDYDVIRQDNGLIVTLVKPQSELQSEATPTAVQEDVLVTDENDIEETGVEAQVDVEGHHDSLVSEPVAMETTEPVEAEALEGAEEVLIVEGEETFEEMAPEGLKPDAVTNDQAATQIISIDKMVGDESADIHIEADGILRDYKIFTIPGEGVAGGRIVCDIFNVKGMNTKGEQRIAVDALGVQSVRYFSYPDKMRVVVDTDNANLNAYTAVPKTNGLTLSIGGALADSAASPDAISQTDDAWAIEQEEPMPMADEEVRFDENNDLVADETPNVEDLDQSMPADEVVVGGGTLAGAAMVEAAPEIESELANEPDYSAQGMGGEEESDNDEAAGSTYIVVQEEAPLTTEKDSTVTLVEEDEQLLSAAGDSWVNRIDFASEKDGKSAVIIGTTHTVRYTVTKKDDSTLHFKLYGAKLPQSRKFPFITTRFESAVNRIIPVQTPAMKDSALFIIELRESVPYYVDQQDGTIKVNFEASSVPPQAEDMAGLPLWKEVLSKTPEIQAMEKDVAVQSADEDGFLADSGSGPSGTPDMGTPLAATTADSTSDAESALIAPTDQIVASEDDVDLSGDGSFVSWAQKKKYTGEKISVDFFDTDIKNVFRIIRSVSGENFAIDKDVNGKVTMTLDTPVPWDQVLDLVLKMNMLGMISEGGINRIATLDTLKVEEEKRLEFIAAEEKTKQKKKSLEPVFTEYILINYSNAEKEIVPHIEKFLTTERGKISVDQRTNQIILTDTRDKIDVAKDLIKRLDKITPQVIIEARIVEASSSFSLNLGSEWSMNSNPNYDTYNDTLGGTYGYDVAMNNSVASASSVGINFTRLTGAQFLLNAKLMAMESRGEGKIVSAPKVMTMDNKQATITQGVEVPFETVSSEGTQTVFKQVDLKLEVTPHITSDNKISMKINIDKNDLGTLTDSGYTVNTKKVESELLVSDGDTIVIGGIIKSNKTVSEDGIPVLSHIPVLGWLFKSRVKSDEKQEMLVFITPRIVSYEETVR